MRKSRRHLIASVSLLSALVFMQCVAEAFAIALVSIPIVTTLALVSVAPDEKAAQPCAIVMGHLIAYLLGLLGIALTLPGALTASAALLVMLLVDAPQPPAVATPFILSTYPSLGLTLFAPLIIGCFVAITIGSSLRR